MAMSIAEGDWLGAALAGVSYVPYLGDAVAKPFKIIRSTRAISVVEKQAAALAKQIAHYSSDAVKIAQHKMAAAAERARRAKEAAARYAEELKCATCPKSNPFGTQLPTTGKWETKTGAPGEKGNSRWTSDADPPVSIDYKNGYPDFKTSNPKSLYDKGGGEVEILMTGERAVDFSAARDAMRKKLNDPKWPPEPASKDGKAPAGYTWHHTEDGSTMHLVDSKIHGKSESGIAHTGGTSIVSGKDTQF